MNAAVDEGGMRRRLVAAFSMPQRFVTQQVRVVHHHEDEDMMVSFRAGGWATTTDDSGKIKLYFTNINEVIYLFTLFDE